MESVRHPTARPPPHRRQCAASERPERKGLPLSNPPSSLAIARRLASQGVPEKGTPDAVAAGAEQVLAQLFRRLSVWVGTVGCNALFTRALLLSVPHHPVLRGVRYQLQNGERKFECLAENAREYGSEATAEAITAVLASIVTMLNGLIGEDIAMSILDDVPRPTSETPSAPGSGTIETASTHGSEVEEPS